MKSKIAMIIMIMGLALGGFSSAFGSSGWQNTFNSQNGTSYSCNLCHTSAPALNGFGTDWFNPSIGNGSYVITAALRDRDSDSDGSQNGVEIQANTNPGNSASRPTANDTTAPLVTAFNLGTPASLTVPITTFTASDTGGTGVNGYMVTTTTTAPAAGATGWSTTAPSSFSFPAGTTSGTKTLYAWARDASSNVSAGRTANVTISVTTTDTTAPTVTGFIIPPTAGSLTVSIASLSATDNVAVTGYLVNENATKPLAAAAGWSTTVPAGYTFATAGAKTLYAWAKDAAGNVSSGLGQSVTISTGSAAVDVESPEVMEFTLPLTSPSLTVPILAFRAIDNVGPNAYLITTTSAAPSANATGWSANPPTSYTFTSIGAKTLHGWVKDAAGNVSESLWDNVDITIPSDQTPPVVTSFRIPSTSRTFTVQIRRFTVTDDTAVTGYLVTTSSTQPGASDPNWRSTKPTSFTVASTGRKRLYAWAKDAAGNVSSIFRYGTVMVLGNNQEVDD